MAKTGNDGESFPMGGLLHARGNYYITAWKGRPVAKKWPKKRSKPPGVTQQAWIDHFACMAWLTKQPDPKTFDLAKKLTAKTGWYYRDILTAGSVGKIYRKAGVPRITTPTASYSAANPQNVTINTNTAFTLDTKDWDNNVFWASSPNPTRLTCKAAGLYLVIYDTNWVATPSSVRQNWLRINGVTDRANTQNEASAVNGSKRSGSMLWYFNAGDYVECFGRSSASGNNCQVVQLCIVGITAETVK